MALSLTQAQRKQLPDLYTTEGQSNPVAVARFIIGGRGAFYATEFSLNAKNNIGVLFGWMISPLGSDCDEWGYTVLNDTASRHFERDLHFTPQGIREACKANGDPMPPIYD